MKSADPFDGVLLVDKAPAMTSHDVVAIVRKCLNTQRVGHCGTLDPFATGLLLLVIGKSLSGSRAVSTSTPMRCATSGRQKSTSASSAAKASTCALMPTTSASNLAAEPTCRPCDEPSLDDFPWKMRSRLTN